MENRTKRTILNFFIAHPRSKVELIPLYLKKGSAMKDVDPPIFREASADYWVKSSENIFWGEASIWQA